MTKQNRTILLPSDLFFFFVVDCYLGFSSFLKQKDCKNIFYFMCKDVLPTCMQVHHIHAVPSERSRGRWTPETAVKVISC